ncbi:Extradiol ring-cleavage dioxygenase class III protein subunit B [[Leptolyngbya] sp. PCC 7376]|uniref:DODA-type extradiol aromatic ring-opening family dioxygenase n=1 Tax=[Leptolyngbya] sp. PCC 7376 TaxID=111781 RepID=UPI00029ECF8B|nr:class III extradiol ring-cleavage dioxygenase [[Leptolyngbya] sp. PCC 7376]AFY39300.1 Extradiol ring-cleavage dioxygenase class III protein subunit B [[Leptolyngbya] sp. PCC 7376]
MANLPSLFVSHGAPSLILENDATTQFFRNLGKQYPNPAGIVCISAHWESPQLLLTSNPRRETIYDFSGFPKELYEVTYPATGSPELLDKIATALNTSDFPVRINERRGFDHGVWVSLKLMYPNADIPIVQLSVLPKESPEHHFQIGQALRSLREENILIIASGSATHNLREFRVQAKEAEPLDYAVAFDQWLVQAIEKGDRQSLFDYENTAPEAKRNHPTPEHFLPLFVALGAATESTGEQIHQRFTYGALSMSAFLWW